MNGWMNEWMNESMSECVNEVTNEQTAQRVHERTYKSVRYDVMFLQIRQQHRQLLHEHHQRFHAVWGQLLKTGYQNSRFAHQVERFACLYTSHVSNLAFYSPDKSYRYAGLLQLLGHHQY